MEGGRRDAMTPPIILLIGSLVAGVIFALTVGRRLSPTVVWSSTILTTLLLAAIIFVSSSPNTSEAAVYVHAEILLYLLMAVMFTLPVTLTCWLIVLMKRL